MWYLFKKAIGSSMNEYVLIVGGAGYIGSHVNKMLSENGFNTLVYDNLVYGHQDAVKWGQLIVGDINNKEQLRKVFSSFNISIVLHFAAFTYVGESAEDPEKYYLNNLVGTINLLQVMREFKCNKLVFSSTCAIFGEPQYLPLDENHSKSPISPYGRTKLMIEQILQDYSDAYGVKYVSLRYFNAAGADESGVIGEDHNPETHLIPLVLDVALGKRADIKVFGTDYSTQDGSAVRDYIHVNDLADAHARALEYLLGGGDSDCFNLGNGSGYSVLQIIKTAEKITNKTIPTILAERRAGDPAVLIANFSKAKLMLGWQPKHPLEDILQTAWRWHQNKKG
jgi:UDP-glucose 4-epimerase